MARIDYHDIAQEIAAILKGDSSLSILADNITVEEDYQLGPEKTPWVNINLTRRDAPDALQPVAAGTVLRYLVTYTIEIWEFHIEGPTRAAQFRDDIVGKVELVLMAYRTINGKANSSWITGGNFLQKEEDRNVRGAEIVLVVDAKATT